MTFTAVSQFSFEDPIQNWVQITKMITSTLDGTKTITNFWDWLVTQMNDLFNENYPENHFLVTYTFNNIQLMILSNIPNPGGIIPRLYLLTE
ncbi:MAG: hypothetical protein Ta2E_01250 [Mycoplasmoidaceae bacterium]|nr:MAG: hypothetical protein Ta2E_01250 [Mycoplasmoidaceae bacterium]